MPTRPERAKKILVYWMDAMVVVFGLSLAMVILPALAEGRIAPGVALTILGSMASVLVLYAAILRDAYAGRPRPTAKLVACGVFAAVAIVLPTAALPAIGTWSTLAYFWLAAIILYLPLWTVAGIGAGIVTAITWYVTAAGEPWAGALGTQLFHALMLPGATWVWCWLWRTIRDAHDSQEAKAGLAVSEERLRFARDLHDLLGHSLSVITLKSELAAKLSTKDPARAATEMAEVRRLAAASLIEVQVAVDGYRSLDLEEELAGVRAALEAAGARCTIDARTQELSSEARALLAWVVREGATNVLKHSQATCCSITIDGGGLVMRNDGVDAGGQGHQRQPPGNGLRGLAERMATAGGSCTAEPTPAGEFLLRARVPA